MRHYVRSEADLMWLDVDLMSATRLCSAIMWRTWRIALIKCGLIYLTAV